MSIVIRQETHRDYNAISNLIYRAFNENSRKDYIAEPTLVDNLRHNENFDPEMSLVAEAEGEIIGSVLLSPFKFYVLGKEKMGVWVAPLCVDPSYQDRRFGSRLMEEAHRIATEKGYVMSFLLGQESYYPRFGYLTRMFALTGSRLSITKPRILVHDLVERAVQQEDLPWIKERWKEVHQEDLIALYPGDSISQWFSHNIAMKSSIFIEDDEEEERIVGFAKYRLGNNFLIRDFLPAPGYAEEILDFIIQKRFATSTDTLTFAMEAKTLAKILPQSDRLEIDEYKRVSDSFMLKILNHDDPDILAYCRHVDLRPDDTAVISFAGPMDAED